MTCNSENGYVVDNGECKKELKCQIDDEYGQAALPEENPTKYIWNKIVPTDVSSDEYRWDYVTPTEWLSWWYRSSCVWSCADGYHINQAKTECVEDDPCGRIHRNFKEVTGVWKVYLNTYNIDDACKRWTFVGRPSRGDWVTVWRMNANGCGTFRLIRQCFDGTSTITCNKQEANVVTYYVLYFWGDKITVGQNPFSCNGGGQPCVSAGGITLRLTFGNGKQCVTGISPTDQHDKTYNIKDLCPESYGYYGTPWKVEVLWDTIDSVHQQLYDDYEAALPEVYMEWNASCLWDAVKIYG